MKSEEQIDFSVCPRASSTKKPFKGTLRHRGLRIETVVHSDLAGHFKFKTPCGERYVASFIGGESRSSESALVKRKSDLYDKFANFRVRFERAND